VLDKHSQDLTKDTEICMRIKAETLKFVLANNDRFKSLFEMNTPNISSAEISCMADLAERRILELAARRTAEKECLGNQVATCDPLAFKAPTLFQAAQPSEQSSPYL
jgi:hypothetical protein